MSTTAQDALTLARQFLGYKENPPGSNNTLFGDWSGYPHQPWCDSFVSYVLSNVGIPTKYSYCPTHVNVFKAAGRWHTEPEVGDLVFFDFTGKGGLAEHVGIVEGVNPGFLTTIEGNTDVAGGSSGGQVMRKMRPRNSIVLGYGRPQYSVAAGAAATSPVNQVITLGENVQRVSVTVPIGTDGNGWAPVGVDFSKVVGLFVNGPNPPTDGYTTIPRVAAQQRAYQTIITVEGAVPSSNAIVFVSFAG